MPRVINPRQIAKPPSRHSHGIVHNSRAHRLVISGQVGIRPDGTIADGLEGQLLAAWDNIAAILKEAGMTMSDLLKVCVFVTEPGSVRTHRLVLERVLGGHAPVVNYLEVSGLAQPEFLVAIEAEAVSEDADGILDELPGLGQMAIPRFGENR